MSKPIEGRVAVILNIREVVINVGAEQGVREGMVFAILSKESLQVPDPDSGRILGEIDRPKVRVKATEVRDSFSICRTFEVIPGVSYTSLFDLSRAFLRDIPDRPKTLKVGDSDLPQPISEEESYVKVGDRVRQVSEPEMEEATS
jgi:hypothetical protein